MLSQLYKKIRFFLKRGEEPYSSLYKLLGFYPNEIEIYRQAMIHKSSSVECGEERWYNNERLEFLGDAILDAVVGDIVYKHFPRKHEGFLTNTRAKIVKRETLNAIAVKLGLDKLMVYSIKLTAHNNNIYGNALEALVGAIYIDQGYEVCYRYIEEVIINQNIDIDKIARKETNFKSSLIEWSQKYKFDIQFNIIENFADKDGNPVFQSSVNLGDTQIGVGIGYSKKESQQNAAKMAVKKLRTDKDFQLFIAELKKKQTGESTAENDFNTLPEENESVVNQSSAE